MRTIGHEAEVQRADYHVSHMPDTCRLNVVPAKGIVFLYSQTRSGTLSTRSLAIM